jgi:hypothetical protein
MKLLLENWRVYINEVEEPVQYEYDLKIELLEEGKIWDFVKDKTAAAKKLKEKAYTEALRMFINISDKITDTNVTVKKVIDQHVPPGAQVVVLAAIALAIGAVGQPTLAAKVVSGNAAMADVLGALSSIVGENKKKNETTT